MQRVNSNNLLNKEPGFGNVGVGLKLEKDLKQTFEKTVICYVSSSYNQASYATTSDKYNGDFFFGFETELKK